MYTIQDRYSKVTIGPFQDKTDAITICRKIYYERGQVSGLRVVDELGNVIYTP